MFQLSMDPAAVLSAFVLVIAFYLLFATIWYRHLSGALDSDGDGRPRSTELMIDRNAGIVVCPSCSVENKLGYVYCRNCIGELPGAELRPRAGRDPDQRGIF